MKTIKFTILSLILLSSIAQADVTTSNVGVQTHKQQQVLSAFEGVATTPVSEAEIQQVTGKRIGFGTPGLALKLTIQQWNKVICGKSCVRT